MNPADLPEPQWPRRSRLRFWLRRAPYQRSVRPPRRNSRACDALLCAVIVIILAAILFPAFVTARGGSRKSCVGNLNRIGRSMEQYVADWDSYLPPADAWVDCTLPYTNNIKSYDCMLYRQNRRVAYSYAYNDVLANRAISAFEIPADIPLCYDSRLMVRNAHAPGRAGLAMPPRHGASTSPPVNWMVFLDGHTGRVNAQGTVFKPNEE